MMEPLLRHGPSLKYWFKKASSTIEFYASLLSKSCGRVPLESLAGFEWNPWPECSGICSLALLIGCPAVVPGQEVPIGQSLTSSPYRVLRLLRSPLRAVLDEQTAGNSKGSTSMLLYEANNIEEPCAGKPHAGICERAAG
jgi:hypothetical protein